MATKSTAARLYIAIFKINMCLDLERARDIAQDALKDVNVNDTKVAQEALEIPAR